MVHDKGRKSLIKGGVLKLKSKRKKRPILNILLYIILYHGLCCVFKLCFRFVPLLCSLLVLLVNVMHFL